MNFILRIMLMGLLLIGSASILSAQEPPLERRMSISLTNATLDEALNAIMKETGALFLYKSSEINIDSPITLSLENATVASVLDAIIGSLPVTYSSNGSQIILKTKDSAVKPAAASAKLLTGTVRDASGLGAIGATVMVKGTTVGTSTDLDGNFSIKYDSECLLDIMLIGYRTATVRIYPGVHLNVTLEEDVTFLDEVIVVGYGTQKKINMTGSVEAVGGEKMQNMPMPSLSRGLQGLIPNLNIDMADGKPIQKLRV